MARLNMPHWMVCCVVCRVYAGDGNLNAAHFAAEIGIEEEDVINLLEEALPYIGYWPFLYTTQGMH